ncbi:hypothetical protein JRQ81_012224, partial [Phrynocephalus forsythii]
MIPPDPTHHSSLYSRLSKEHSCNFAGLCLMHATVNLDLVILNGSIKGDRP